jgi:hypothetical protein
MADDSNIPALNANEADKANTEETRNPRFVRLPPSEAVVKKAIPLLRNRHSRLPEAVATLLDDPVCTLEVFHRATDPSLAQSRSYLATLQGAVVRLGAARIIKALEELYARPFPDNQEVVNHLERLRDFATRTSNIAKILAFHANAGSPDEAQAAGLMTQIGLMVACVFYGTGYVELAGKPTKASIIYHLEKRHHFHVNQFQSLYLLNYGLPSGLLIALDQDEPCKSARQAALRFVVQSSIELVEAYDTDKWKRYALLGNVPGRSVYRLLQIPEKHHELFYEEATEYLSGKPKREPTSDAPISEAQSDTLINPDSSGNKE